MYVPGLKSYLLIIKLLLAELSFVPLTFTVLSLFTVNVIPFDIFVVAVLSSKFFPLLVACWLSPSILTSIAGKFALSILIFFPSSSLTKSTNSPFSPFKDANCSCVKSEYVNGSPFSPCSPLSPVSPLSPLSPLSPCSPLILTGGGLPRFPLLLHDNTPSVDTVGVKVYPCEPRSPLIPVSPVAPVAPVSPLSPLSPFSPFKDANCSCVKSEYVNGSPLSPLSPLSPFNKSVFISVVISSVSSSIMTFILFIYYSSPL